MLLVDLVRVALLLTFDEPELHLSDQVTTEKILGASADSETMPVPHTFILGVLLMLVTASCKPSLVSAKARAKTFESSQWDPGWKSPKKMVKAGFYSTGFEDEVKCYHCNVGLRSWDAEDEPWDVHIQFSPKCFHNRLYQIANRNLTLSETDLQRDSRKFYTIGRRLLEVIRDNDSFRIVSDLAYGDQFVTSVIARAYLRNGILKSKAAELMEACQEMEESEEVLLDEVNLVMELIKGVAAEEPMIPQGATGGNSGGRGSGVARRQPGLLGGARQDDGNPEETTAETRRVTEFRQSVSEEKENSVKSGSASSNGSLNAAAAANETPEIPENTESFVTEDTLPKNILRDRCRICETRVLRYTLLPCAHLAVCEECIKTAKRCPECQAPIRSCVKTFIG